MTTLNNFLKFSFVTIYMGISFLIFNLVYGTSQEVIDEYFHIDQGLHYCHGFFKAVSFPFVYIRRLKRFFNCNLILVGSEDYNISRTISPVIRHSPGILQHVLTPSNSADLLDPKHFLNLRN